MTLYLRDQLLKTAKDFLDAHNNRDFARIRTLCDPSCVHRAGPPSVKSPDRNNDEYVSFTTEVLGFMHTYVASITDSVVDDVKKKVVLSVQAIATADTGEFENEYIILLAITEDGKKVVDHHHFADSQKLVEWSGRVGEFAKEAWEKK
jgi:hypothetical protein